MQSYFRPLVQTGPGRPDRALALAGGWGWFCEVEILSRDMPPRTIPASETPADVLDRLTRPRAAIAGMGMERPRIMGILNVTPDSFSDGGKHAAHEDAVRAGLAMQAAGVDLIDIGGESTRPGAANVDIGVEIARTAPVIAALRAEGLRVPLSIDTRKAAVAEAALEAGATLVNDVSGATHDPALAPLCAARAVPLCVMHAQGDPATMQQNPRYDDVLLDVYDFLAARIEALVALGIARSAIIADPGIGFGKTQAHNLALLARLGLFHGLGVPILLGASRKGFIGNIGGTKTADNRAPGSIGVALAALGHGVQMLRVHDVAETRQATALWRAATEGHVK
jgi:dihydropteroate synthase